MIKTKNLTFKRSFLVVTISVLFISVAVYAATTISNNIATDGTLDVTGLSTHLLRRLHIYMLDLILMKDCQSILMVVTY